MKVVFSKLDKMIEELKDKGIEEVRLSAWFRDVQGASMTGAPMAIRTISIIVTADMSTEGREIITEYLEPVGQYDRTMLEERIEEIRQGANRRIAEIQQLLESNFKYVRDGRYEVT